ncbi:hypothetical protein GOL31_23505 [Sinorhizobium medicae]|nr:hypothetical protein [Sinorhizobium medicae]
MPTLIGKKIETTEKRVPTEAEWIIYDLMRNKNIPMAYRTHATAYILNNVPTTEEIVDGNVVVDVDTFFSGKRTY